MTSKNIKDYKDLTVWQKGLEIVDLVYKITLLFPKQEKYGLSSQMQRSAVSVPSNIAEGFDRQYTKEYRQFLFISLSSCAELETQTIIAKRRDYILKNLYVDLIREIYNEKRMLRGLIRVLKSLPDTRS